METFEKSLFGSLALSKRFLSREQLDEALAVQAASATQGVRPPRLGEILISRGYLTDEQLRSLLNSRSGGGSLFGEIAEAWGLCSREQIDEAIALQIEYRLQRSRPPRIGELLLSSGALKAHQIHSVLKAQGKQVVQCPGCATSYNALHVKEGLGVICPRCNTAFTPIPPLTETVVDGEPIGDVRSDATAFLAAVEDEATQKRVSARLAVLPNLKLPQYVVHARIGADASGLLYKATDTALQRAVSLRILNENATTEADLNAWREAAESAGALEHPRLQRMIATHYDQGKLIIASEYHEGQSLRQMLQRGGKIEVPAALTILIQCAEAFAFGLSRQVIHGDLRPSRVIIGAANVVHVCGLGMPKRIHANLRMLTGTSGAAPLYAAPEVLRDAASVGEQSDVYSLCALGYHMITGRAPQIVSLTHRGQFRSAPPTLLAPNAINPTIPTYVSRMLLKGLARNPADRYVSAIELLEDLNTCRNAVKDRVAEVPAIAPFFERSGGLRVPYSRVASASPRRRRHKTAWRSRGGARLTLSDPPPSTEAMHAVGYSDGDAFRSAGTYPLKPAQWTRAHTGAAVAAAVVLLIGAVMLLRPPPDPRMARRSGVSEQVETPAAQNMTWLLQKDFDESVLAYQRQYPKDFNGIRTRADEFIRLNEPKFAGSAPVLRARELRLEQAKVGVSMSRPALEKKIQGLLQQDRFKDALYEVSRWGAYWGKEAAGLDEQVLRDHVRAEQKAHATAWLSQGQAGRAEGEWDKARESFNKIQAHLDSEYAEEARRELAITDEAELRSKTDRNEALLHEEQARLLAQREAAAPVLLQRLVSDMQEPLSKLNFPLAWKTVVDVEAPLAGTSQVLAYQTIRNTISRIEALRDRAVQAAVDGRLSDFKLHVKDWDGFIVSATVDGPVVKSGDIQAAVPWSALSPDVLSHVFERSTDPEDPTEVLDLGLYHLWSGDPQEATELMDQAQHLGAMVDHHRELIPIMCRVASSAAANVSAAERGQELTQEAFTRSSLKGMDWEISRGRWVVNPDASCEGTPDAGMHLVSLRREVPTFNRIEVEVRGDGDLVGFSFGKGRRFMIRPISIWQKLSLHLLPGNQLEMRVDGERRDSLEALTLSTTHALPQELFLRGLGSRIEFRNFAIDGKAVRPHIVVTPSAGSVVPAVQPTDRADSDTL